MTIQRRDFLKLAGAAGVGAVAGRMTAPTVKDSGQSTRATPSDIKSQISNMLAPQSAYAMPPDHRDPLAPYPKSRGPEPWMRTRQQNGPVDLKANQPPRVESVNGVLNFDLEMIFANLVINGQVVEMRTYNGSFPGTTLVVRPGDIMFVREINHFPEAHEPPPETINHPHGFNVVNLHTHGFNVSPEDNEDNVLIEVHPGATFDHEIHIPADHPTGTFWYHPHKHGAASLHLGSGMAGALLVVDPANDIRSIPEVGAAEEVILVFQEVFIRDREDGTGEVPSFPLGQGFFRGEWRLQLTVNGFATNAVGANNEETPPIIRMRPGEVAHWRLVNASTGTTTRLHVTGHMMNVIAYDGITLDFMETVDEFIWSPGQRRDVLIKASDTPGTYEVKNLEHFQNIAAPNPEELMLLLIVEGEPTDMPLPMALNPPRDRLPVITDAEIVNQRQMDFVTLVNEPEFLVFSVNGVLFNGGRVDQTMLLGTAEEWTITNNELSQHPFHIHVNWFQVHRIVDGEGNETIYDPPRVMDTVTLPIAGTVTIRHRFENFQGKAVFHCHFLDHEDLGMMQIIEIVDGSPRTSLVTPAGGTVVSHDYENQVQARFAPGAVPSDTEITYQFYSPPDFPAGMNPAPGPLPDGGTINPIVHFARFFSLTAGAGGAGIDMLDRTYTLEVKYSVQQVAPREALEGSVALYRWDGAMWTTDGVSVTFATPSLVTCTTRHFGLFAVLGRLTEELK